LPTDVTIENIDLMRRNMSGESYEWDQNDETFIQFGGGQYIAAGEDLVVPPIEYPLDSSSDLILEITISSSDTYAVAMTPGLANGHSLWTYNQPTDSWSEHPDSGHRVLVAEIRDYPKTTIPMDYTGITDTSDIQVGYSGGTLSGYPFDVSLGTHDIELLTFGMSPTVIAGGSTLVTNIEFYDGSWTSHFDQTAWTPTGGFSWDSDQNGWYCNSDTGFLTAIGTWADGYRPTKARITFTSIIPEKWVNVAAQDNAVMETLTDCLEGPLYDDIYMLDHESRIAKWNSTNSAWDLMATRSTPTDGLVATYSAACSDYGDGRIYFTGLNLGLYYYNPITTSNTMKFSYNSTYYNNANPTQLLMIPGDSMYTWASNSGTHGVGLKKYNGTNGWVDSYVPSPAWHPYVDCGMCIHGNALYIAYGSGDSNQYGKLFRWDGTYMTEVASRAGGTETAMIICSDGSNIYGAGVATGNLYVWDGNHNWTYLGSTPTHTYNMLAITAFDGVVYGAEQFFELFAWNVGVSSSWDQVDNGLAVATKNRIKKLFKHKHSGRTTFELYGAADGGGGNALYRFQIPEN
jgi:hypothetical protein